MNCGAAQEQIGLYLDGELAAEELAALEEHLRNCPDCAAEHENLRELIAYFAESDELIGNETVPSDLWDRIENRLETRKRSGHVVLRLFKRPMAIAASLA